MKILIPAAVGVTSLLTIAMMAGAGWDRPPVETAQRGYRGVGMEHVYNPRVVAKQLAAAEVPPPAYDIDPEYESPVAASVYENIQVLTDITEDQLLRLMDSMTAWVSPEVGCEYCHNLEDLADDSLYTHKVSLRMLEMTRHINNDLADHVAPAGVTCYTCHRGKNVPDEIWYDEAPKRDGVGGMAAVSPDGQNMPNATVGLTSLPASTFDLLRGDKAELRVATRTALPSGNTSTIQDTEMTYGLMFHLSKSLGVNCTFCHNSRSFYDWKQSPLQRTTAWHGIDIVRGLNGEYLEPLQELLPPHRLGPTGDAPKANCATCHQGAYKPLFGANVIADFPSLGGEAVEEDTAMTEEVDTPATVN